MNMRFTSLFKTLSVCLVLLYLPGCAQPKVMKKQAYRISEDSVSVALMPIDIQLSALTAGGINEVRADWTATADRYISDALKRELIPSTKRDVFDWSLGHEVSTLRESTGADYGLLVYMRDILDHLDRLAATTEANALPEPRAPPQAGLFDSI